MLVCTCFQQACAGAGPGEGRPAMQLIVPRQQMAEALRLAEPLLPLRSPEPLLEHVLIRAEGAGCTLLACDREVSLCLPLDAEVRRPGAALVPGRRLAALLRQ